MRFDYSGKPGEYAYTQTQYGKSAEGIVAVGAQSSRNGALQRSVGGTDRGANDHGGHLIAHSLGGENTERNMDAQNKNVNQRGMRSIERDVTNLAKDGQHTVYYHVENYNSNGSQRPDATMVIAAVRDDATGKEDAIFESMQNASYEEQEEWNRIADELEPEARNAPTLSEEDNALAHEYADATDLDAKLGEGEHFSFDSEGNIQSGSLDVGESMDSGLENDGGMDGGLGDGDGGLE